MPLPRPTLSHRRSSAPARPATRMPILRIALVLFAALPLAAGACTGTAASTAPTATLKPTASAAPTATATATPAPTLQASIQASTSPATGQTDLPWGRIWDSVPTSFPRYTGSQPTEIPNEPASTALSVPGTPAVVADWMKNALLDRGFSIESLTGPLEDGSRTIAATDGLNPDCRVQVTVKPLGTMTVEIVYYGAACSLS